MQIGPIQAVEKVFEGRLHLLHARFGPRPIGRDDKIDWTGKVASQSTEGFSQQTADASPPRRIA
tara:strand:- start:1867 stop:2058 length:192 start_codon:yes stop_codon:yes gene_type:complete